MPHRIAASATSDEHAPEEGLAQEFNSLDAQYEACAAYITSQKAEGWVLLPERYGDGGISGDTMERPGLQRLLADIEVHHVRPNCLRGSGDSRLFVELAELVADLVSRVF